MAFISTRTKPANAFNQSFTTITKLKSSKYAWQKYYTTKSTPQGPTIFTTIAIAGFIKNTKYKWNRLSILYIYFLFSNETKTMTPNYSPPPPLAGFIKSTKHKWNRLHSYNNVRIRQQQFHSSEDLYSVQNLLTNPTINSNSHPSPSHLDI